MRFFRLIESDINTAPLLDEIHKNEPAWGAYTKRQEQIPVQKDTNTILIRHAVSRPDFEDPAQNQEDKWTKMAPHFPLACQFMENFAQKEGAKLSRATIVRLKPKSEVYRHIDYGAYYLIRNRYHLVLQSKSGSVMVSGGEKIRMKEGELWWFDNKQNHGALNESAESRIH